MTDDEEFKRWLTEVDRFFDDEYGFELQPDPAPKPMKRIGAGCAAGIHYKNKTAIALPEKQFERWLVCRNCGKPLSKANNY